MHLTNNSKILYTFYFGMLALSILIGTLFFVSEFIRIQEDLLMWVAFIPFFLFVYGLIGLLVSTQIKEERTFSWWIIFPILITILFYVLLFVHIFLLEPLLCPCLR
jgi:hypothetical protein